MSSQQIEKAELFRRLHQGPDILILPNAWDVMSAKIFEHASFQAVGTTSSGIAATMGYPDGEYIASSEMIEVIERIVRNTAIPVSADIEAGYGASADEVIETVERVLKAGVAGINIEDSTGIPEQPLLDIARQVEKIKAARGAADSAGIPLVINARTDTYKVAFWDSDAQFRETIKRADSYLQAGADCIFVPGKHDAAAIARLVAAIDAPLNIIVSPVTPNIAELKALGVARVSIGAGGLWAALGTVRKIASELSEHGTYESLVNNALSKSDFVSLLNRVFS